VHLEVLAFVLRDVVWNVDPETWDYTLSTEIWKDGRMATRRYQQRRRAESAEATRRRILDAVYDRLREAPTEPLGLDQVAKRAGVARTTIYGSFGSRAGMLDAFADDLWSRSGLAALTEAVAHPDARGHLRGGIAAATRMFAAERDVYRVLFSLAQLDPSSVGATVDRMEEERAAGMAHLATRLAEQGELRKGLSMEDAAATLWALTSFEVFDLLFTGRALPLDEVIALLTATTERAVCR
jgi:AcrR family transcriptional regulator